MRWDQLVTLVAQWPLKGVLSLLLWVGVQESCLFAGPETEVGVLRSQR